MSDNMELLQALADADTRFNTVVARGEHVVYKLEFEIEVAVDRASIRPYEVPPGLTAAEETVLWALVRAQEDGVVFRSVGSGSNVQE